MKKRMFSVFLVVLIVCSLSPVSVFAMNSSTDRVTIYNATEIVDEECICQAKNGPIIISKTVHYFFLFNHEIVSSYR
jgi:hypothetical protein